MSDKQQTPSTSNASNVRRSLILVIAAIIVGTGWFVLQSKNDTEKILDNTKKSQPDQKTEATDQYKGWKSYTWANQGVTFKYPGDWNVSENESMDRVYVKNSQVDLLKEETPADFQQVWLSADADETTVARENSIKAGESDFRQVSGKVTASTIKSGSLTINTYEYETVGGPTLEAYWTNKAGKRFLATTSTEVGQQNQKDMVTNLKKVLATITLAQ